MQYNYRCIFISHMHTYKLAPRLTFKLKNWKEKILTYIEVHVYIYPYIHTLMYTHTPFILMHMYVYLLFIVILIFTFTVDIISKSTKQKKGIYKKRLLNWNGTNCPWWQPKSRWTTVKKQLPQMDPVWSRSSHTSTCCHVRPVRPPGPQRPADSESRHASREASGIFLHRDVWEPLSPSPLDDVHAFFTVCFSWRWSFVYSMSGQHNAVCFGWWSTERGQAIHPAPTGTGDGTKCMRLEKHTNRVLRHWAPKAKSLKPQLCHWPVVTISIPSPEGYNQSAVHVVLRWCPSSSEWI